jgi:hypothetical protein
MREYVYYSPEENSLSVIHEESFKNYIPIDKYPVLSFELERLVWVYLVGEL